MRDARAGEPVVGAAVFGESPVIGTATDQFGAHTLTLPVGRYTLNVRGIGLRNLRRQVVLYASGQLDIEVEQDITPLKEVVVVGGQDQNVSSTRMSVEKLYIKQIKHTAAGSHQLSNTAAMSPTDTWKLSDRYLRPQVSDQLALGYYHNF